MSSEVQSLLPFLSDKERAELNRLVARAPIWMPLPGPQMMAYNSEADVIGFGGAAGGGKTDLTVGKALTRFQKTFVVRKNGTEHAGMIDRLADMFGTRDGYNGKDQVWRFAERGVPRQIEFGSVPNPKDEEKYRGRPHDLLVFDEATSLSRYVVEFLMTWNRTTDPRQKCQAVLTFNPPTDVEGRWVIEYFAPWLDASHPCPAEPGEIRWFASLPDPNQPGQTKDLEVIDGRPFVLNSDGHPQYEFDPTYYAAVDVITPKSRTFIPSRITDNPHLLGTGYMSQLQALPEPLRSQMLKGDFFAGLFDDPWQVIPTSWVEQAMARWKPMAPKKPMDSLGVDVARGGKDNTIIAPRHDWWFDKLQLYPGKETPDGASVAGQVITHHTSRAVVHIDVIGVGASPYDCLKDKVQTVAVNVAVKSNATDKSGKLTFSNLRSELWWKMREDLDPASNNGIALPPDPQLLKELCAPRWKLQGMDIVVQSRDEIVKKIGRSPDRATAVVLANMKTPKRDQVREMGGMDDHAVETYSPYANVNPRRR